jgi:hypothetical protein
MMKSGGQPDSKSRRQRRPDRGIDLPPSLSGRTLQTQPLHRICTLSTNLEGTSICPPVVLFQRFIASVSYSSGILKLYELKAEWVQLLQQQQQTIIPLTQIQPQWKLEVVKKEDESRVVAMTSVELLKVESKSLGYMAVATSEGNVFVVEVFADQEPRLVYSLSTDIMNVVAVACWIDETGGLFHIAIGAKSGVLEEWKIAIDWQQEPQLVWRGSFGTSLHSLVFATTLSACISQRPRMGRALQSSTVEVLNRSKLATDWKEQGGDTTILLSLSDYCVWPDEGREWIRSPSGGDDIALGTNILCRIDNVSWAAALADGSVGVLNSFLSAENDFTSWGVILDSHQATLPFPAIGLGRVDLVTGPHLACCLRGGTVYCLPMDDDDDDGDDSRSSVSTFLPPTSEEEDYAFLHGFAAGNIQLKGDSASFGATETTPIIIYSGDGGTMEVYACGLLPRSNKDVAQLATLQKMLEHGTIQVLLDALRTMSSEERLLQKPYWSQAREECQGDDCTAKAVMTNQSNAYDNTRALLLSLAE